MRTALDNGLVVGELETGFGFFFPPDTVQAQSAYHPIGRLPLVDFSFIAPHHKSTHPPVCNICRLPLHVF